jgi:hypothetical protein
MSLRHCGFCVESMRAEWTPPASCKGPDREMKHEGFFEGREIASRPSRIDVYYDALAQVGDEEIAVQIFNISARGFRLRSHVPLEEGEEVLLVVPKLSPVRGLVRWANGCEAGGVLLDAVAL